MPMRSSRLTKEQNAFALKQAETGTPASWRSAGKSG